MSSSNTPAARAVRGARAYGEVAGVGATSDAYHLVIPSPDNGPCSRAISSALADAGVTPSTLDYVNAHATSTPVGDAFESGALRVFGDYTRTIPVSSTKSMTGHLISAMSLIEAVACLAAFKRQAVPPTINLDDPDPDCNLCHVPHEARPHRVNTALSTPSASAARTSAWCFEGWREIEKRVRPFFTRNRSRQSSREGLKSVCLAQPISSSPVT